MLILQFLHRRREQPVSEEDADAGCGVMDQLDMEAEQTHDTGQCVSTSDASNQPLFDCPEPLCTRKFRYNKNLLNHMEFGKHHYVPIRESLQDYTLKKYKQNVETLHWRDELQEIADEQIVSLQHMVTPTVAPEKNVGHRGHPENPANGFLRMYEAGSQKYSMLELKLIERQILTI